MRIITESSVQKTSDNTEAVRIYSIDHWKPKKCVSATSLYLKNELKVRPNAMSSIGSKQDIRHSAASRLSSQHSLSKVLLEVLKPE